MHSHLKILVCHNYYRQRGGEDVSTEKEIEMLRSHGHEVITYTRHNHEIQSFHPIKKGILYFNSAWQKKAYRDISNLIKQHQPDICHFQNIFPLISPSGYQAAADAGIPVIQTVRNFRMICPGGLLLRNRHQCERCVNGDFSAAHRYRCYRGSLIQTHSVVRMIEYNRRKGTFEQRVDMYIAPSDFVREKHVEAGFKRERIMIKPNFEADHGKPEPGGRYCVFAGRLSMEKGVDVLLDAWKEVDFPVKVIGEGPLMNRMRNEKTNNMELLGYLEHRMLIKVLKGSRFLVFPSICHETFGRTIIESFSCGKPAVVSSPGTGKELVRDGATGFHFQTGNARDLARKVNMLAKNEDMSIEMGLNALKEFRQKYTIEQNYRILMDIYQRVIRMKKK